MSNGEICRWAWENSKGNRNVLWEGILFSLIPGLFNVWFSFLWGKSGLISWWEIPMGWLSQMLSFGLFFLALEPVTGRKCDFRDVFLPFHRHILKKAATLSLFFVLLNTVLTLYPTSLIQRGREMMDAGMAEIERLQIIDMASAAYQQYFEGSRLTTRGQRLSGILTFPPVLLAIPVNYFLFFREEKSVGEMLAEGAGLVVRFFWRILGLGLRCCSVLIVGCFCVVFIRGRVLPYLVLLVFLVFWLPWSMLASAKLAAEMIGVGPEDPWWART